MLLFQFAVIESILFCSKNYLYLSFFFFFFFQSIVVRLFGKPNEALKTVPENGQMNKTYGILRPCSNQPLVKARTQALATNSSIALTHATNHQKSTSNFVRTSVSSFSHKHKPLLMSGNGWV